MKNKKLISGLITLAMIISMLSGLTFPAGAATLNTNPSISLWSSGADKTQILYLQMNLYGYGYTVVGTPDGLYGNNTKSAVTQFQQAFSAECGTADGLAGTKTLTKLVSEIKLIQTNLQKHGYTSVPADGVFDESTKTAVKQFQTSKGLTSDGIAGSQTRAKLAEQPASTLGISGYNTPPASHTQGQSFSIKGTITSNYTISNVTVAVKNASGSTEISASAAPNATSYDIVNIDASIKFGTLTAGAKTYVITATDTKGTKTLVSSSFTISAAPAVSAKRQAVVDYMRNMATVKWTPTTTRTFVDRTNTYTYTSGTTYSGIPYSQTYRTASYETFVGLGTFSNGILNVSGTLNGTDCSSSVSYALKSQGLITGGPYATSTIAGVSGVKKLADMANLKAGDFVNSASSHIRLVVKNDTVNKTVTVIEQCGQGKTYNGMPTSWKIDAVYTYTSLEQNSYIPYTLTGYGD